MKKDRSQAINAVLIAIGGILLIFQLTNEERNVYILVIGLVFLMFGLYRATNHWSYTKDDYKKLDKDEVEDFSEKDKKL